MKLLKKYLLLFFLLENIAVQTSLLSAYSDYFFYPFLALGLLFFIDGSFVGNGALKKFQWAYLIMFLYVFYEFTIGNNYLNNATLLYLVAKLSTLSIIITCINYNYSFYTQKSMYYIAIAMSILLLYGLISGDTGGEDMERLRAGFYNSNTTGEFGSVIIAIILFLQKEKGWNYKYILLIITGLVGVLIAGSRAGFLMLVLSIFFCYGFNAKTIGFSLACVFFALFILPLLGFHSVLFDRVYGTIDGTVELDREEEREAAIWMIKNNPWIGWGFGAKNIGYSLTLSSYGAHNGYLETIKYMGVIVGGMWILVIILTVIKSAYIRIRRKISMDLFFTLVIVLLVKAMYETLFTGIHEFITNLFFVCLAITSYKNYRIKKNYYD